MVISNERNKRSVSSDSDDSSSESDVSSSDSDDSSSSDSDDSSSSDSDDSSNSDSDDSDRDENQVDSTTTPVDECAVLNQYIQLEISIPTGDPESFNDILEGLVLFNITVITQTVPAFFALLTSAPTLFDDLSLAVDAASDLIVIPPTYFQNPTVDQAATAFNALAPDFIDTANNFCGISLTEQQHNDVMRLFDVVLPIFAILSADCELFSQPLVEQAVTDAVANVGTEPTALVLRLEAAAGVITILTDRLLIALNNVLQGLVDDQFAAGQSIRDELLLILNDFCGIPTFGDVTRAQLDEYFSIFFD